MTLYHYCSNIKAFSILKSATLRMSDVRKSNDYNELQLFFPDILETVWVKARENPYINIRFKNKQGVDALGIILNETHRAVEQELKSGSFSNFVVCFSEKGDSLSQWRGYADDGQGCNIGFSLKWLKEKVGAAGNELRLEKVKYLSSAQFDKLISEEADKLIYLVQDLYQWAIESEETLDNVDEAIIYNFKILVFDIISDSLRYKMKGFSEEKEWRLFLANQIHKTNWEYLRDEREWTRFTDKVDFNVTDNDLVAFCPIEFKNEEDKAVAEIVLGPNNNINDSDINLFLKKYKYIKTKCYTSSISYRKK